MRPPQSLWITHEQRSVAVREKQPLVRIEHDRVGPLDAPHGLLPSLREHEEAAVRRVDMQPQSLGFGHVGGATQIVDGPRVRGACAGHEHEGLQSTLPVFGDAPPQVVEANLIGLIGGDLPYVILRKTRQDRRLPNGVVGLVRRVDRSGQKVVRKAFPPRGDHGSEARQGPPAGEDATRAGRVADDLTEPPNDVQL